MQDQLKDKPRGVIRVHQSAHPEFGRLLAINETDTQGRLRDDGRFEQIHHLLLLPASYAIVALYCDNASHGCWRILVESDDIPRVEEGEFYPDLEPIYMRENDTVRLLNIHAKITKRALSMDAMLKGLL